MALTEKAKYVFIMKNKIYEDTVNIDTESLFLQSTIVNKILE